MKCSCSFYKKHVLAQCFICYFNSTSRKEASQIIELQLAVTMTNRFCLRSCHLMSPFKISNEKEVTGIKYLNQFNIFFCPFIFYLK